MTSQQQPAENTGDAFTPETETTEATGEETPREPAPSRTAVETAEGNRRRRTKADDERIFFQMLEQAVEGQGDADIAAAAEKHLIEKGEINPDAAKETGALLNLLLTDSRFSEAFKQMESLHAGRRKEILRSICLPVLNGHLTAQDFANLVPNGVKIIKPGDVKNSLSENGCEGVAYYHNGQILLTEKAIATGTASDGRGGEVTLDSGYFEHLMCHELGHGVTESTVFAGNGKEISAQMNGPEKQFSSEMLRYTREILDQAEQIKDTQPAYIRFYLDALGKADQDFQAMGAAQKKKFGSIEHYREVRRYRAAKEIITDYAGIFMRSDSSYDDFVNKSLEMADKDGLAQFLSANLGEAGADKGNSVEIAKAKIRELNEALRNKTETTDSIKQKHPELATLLGSYRAFHNTLTTQFKGVKGSAQAAEKGDEFDYDYYFMGDGGYGGNYDPGYSSPQNTARGEQKGSGSLMNELGGFIKAFGEEAFGSTVTNALG